MTSGTLKSSIGARMRAVAAAHGYRIKGGSAGWPAVLVNPALKLAGVELIPQSQFGQAYIDFRTTLANARKAGKTVSEHVANLWGEHGVVEAFVDYLDKSIPLASCLRVLEIGAGTGRFTEPILNATKASHFEVYETNAEWSTYLAKTYGVIAHEADGQSLGATPDASQDLVHAHYVFVYLNPAVAFAYFDEIARVCAPGGYVVFDAFTDNLIDLERIRTWIKTSRTWPIILPRRSIDRAFAEAGFELVSDGYAMPTYGGLSQYLIFRKSA